jgi:hypothetical protein
MKAGVAWLRVRRAVGAWMESVIGVEEAEASG